MTHSVVVVVVVVLAAKIEVVKCPKDPREWRQVFEIYPVGINEKVLVDLEMMCQCDCEKPGHRVRILAFFSQYRKMWSIWNYLWIQLFYCHLIWSIWDSELFVITLTQWFLKSDLRAIIQINILCFDEHRNILGGSCFWESL